jgi:tRNA(adenine34) deaminase
MASSTSLQGDAAGATSSADERFMRRAIELAALGERRPGFGPIGCVIVQDGKIIGEGSNEADARCDPTAHAEMVAIRRAAGQVQGTELRDATLYSTLQPCGMCSMAAIWARVGRVVYGAERHQVHRMYFEGRHLNTIDFIHDAFRDDLAVRGGVLAEACAALYYGPNDDVPLSEQTNI